MLASLDGDGAAYRRLLEALRERLRIYFGRRLGADAAETEDLVQETLIAVHARRATYDHAQPVTAWIYAMARYKLVDHFRRTGRRHQAPLDEAAMMSVEDDSEAVHARYDVERGLAALPANTRDLVRSVKLDQTSVADVAARTGLSEGAVKVAVHRGLTRLAAVLGGRRPPDGSAP